MVRSMVAATGPAPPPPTMGKGTLLGSTARTSWPGCSLCTPAMTTRSPRARPFSTTTPSSRKGPVVTLRGCTSPLWGLTTHTVFLPS